MTAINATLATALLNACRAAVNADTKMSLKMREVYTLLQAAGFSVDLHSKATPFGTVLATYTKGENLQLLEVWAMVQNQQRIALESQASPKGETSVQGSAKADAKGILAKLDSQWKNLIRTEVAKLHDAQSQADKDAAAKAKNVVQDAAATVAALLEAFTKNPGTLSEGDVLAANAARDLFAALDGMTDTLVLAVRQRTFDIMKARKESAKSEQAIATTTQTVPLAA